MSVKWLYITKWRNVVCVSRLPTVSKKKHFKRKSKDTAPEDRRTRPRTCQTFGDPAERKTAASSGLGQCLDQNSKPPRSREGQCPQRPPVKAWMCRASKPSQTELLRPQLAGAQWSSPVMGVPGSGFFYLECSFPQLSIVSACGFQNQKRKGHRNNKKLRWKLSLPILFLPDNN